MTIHRHISRAFATGLTLALTATACGSDGPKAAPSTAATAATASTDTASTETDSTEYPFFVGPIDKFLGFGIGAEPSDEEQAENDEKSRQVEQRTATCMKEQGFDYVPIEPSSGTPFTQEYPYSLPGDQFAKQFGYGMTTIDPVADDSASTDPNQAIVDALGIPERKAYYKALYGDLIGVDDDGNMVKNPMKSTEGTGTSSACSTKASDAVYGTSDATVTTESASFDAIEQAIGALYDSIDADPRLKDAKQTWIDCMSDAGHPGYTDVNDASDDVYQKASDLLGDQLDQTGVDAAALADMRAYEISVATADYTCKAPYDDVHDAVETELENAFIESHRTELEQYRDGLADGTAGQG